MATWEDLPESTLARIMRYLPLNEMINVSHVCKSWNFSAMSCYTKVDIHEATLYEGSQAWCNTQRLNARSPCNAINSIVSKIPFCTDRIQILDVDLGLIDDNVLKILFTSQRGLVKLRLRNERKAWCTPTQTMIKEIVYGIALHKVTLEEIDVQIDVNCEKLPFLSEIFGFPRKEICFPNLKSLKFEPVQVLGNNASLLFEKMFANGKIVEIGHECKLLNPSFSSFLRDGKLSKANELNRTITVDESNLIMTKCKNISKFGFDFKVTDDINNEQFKKMLCSYGDKLESMRCYVGTDIIKTVDERCNRIKEIAFRPSPSIDTTVLLNLRNLNNIVRLELKCDLILSVNEMSLLIVNCAEVLEYLSLYSVYRGMEFETVLSMIQIHCKKLKEVHFLHIPQLQLINFRVVASKPIFFVKGASLNESLLLVLGELLKGGKVEFCRWLAVFHTYGEYIRYFELSLCNDFTLEEKMILIAKLPNCKLILGNYRDRWSIVE